MSVEEQLKQLICSTYGTVSAFCKEKGFPYSTIANIFSRGISSLGVDTALKICDDLGISLDGLARGLICLNGENGGTIAISNAEAQLLAQFRALPCDEKEKALASIKNEVGLCDYFFPCDPVTGCLVSRSNDPQTIIPITDATEAEIITRFRMITSTKDKEIVISLIQNVSEKYTEKPMSNAEEKLS